MSGTLELVIPSSSDVIDAPRGELINDGIDIRLRARFAVVEIDHSTAVVVVLRRVGRDLVSGIGRPENSGVFLYGLLRDPCSFIDAEFESEGVNVSSESLDPILRTFTGVIGRVDYPPAVTGPRWGPEVRDIHTSRRRR